MPKAPLDQGQALVVMHDEDDVATALRELAVGERLSYGSGPRAGTLEVRQPIPFGHKIALRDLPAGAPVHKYGSVIGRATVAVAAGEHVHVHNLGGVRGRGDLAAAGNVHPAEEGGADAASR